MTESAQQWLPTKIPISRGKAAIQYNLHLQLFKETYVLEKRPTLATATAC